MDSPWLIGFLAFLGYLLGSIPFGVVMSHLLGVIDPRSAGSKNVGFTNVLRVSGKKAGILTLIGDMGKGWFVGWAGTLIFNQEPAMLFVALASIVGHLHSIFLGFKGGKGVATALGAVLGLAPWIGLTLMGIWGGSGLSVEIFVWWCALGLWSFSGGGGAVSSILALRGICLPGDRADLAAA